MSDEKPSAIDRAPRPPAIITEEEMQVFFREKGIASNCPMCKTDLWWTMDATWDGTNTVTTPSVNKSGIIDFNKIVSLLPIICSNCYYRRQRPL